MCYFTFQINRNKNKWKFYLKDGIMNLNGKDYVFQKANGDAEWWNENCVVKNLFLYFLNLPMVWWCNFVNCWCVFTFFLNSALYALFNDLHQGKKSFVECADITVLISVYLCRDFLIMLTICWCQWIYFCL